MSHLPIWYLDKIPAEVIDAVKEDFMSIKPINATMGMNSEITDLKFRDTIIRFDTSNHEFSKRMYAFAEEANKICGWGYEVNSHEPIQFGEYRTGQHYDWHVDWFPLSGAEKDRKLSVVCMLNDPSEFTGGELWLRLNSEYVAPLEKGSIICFPSIIEHKVAPVLSGIRYTAVMWLSGPKFK